MSESTIKICFRLPICLHLEDNYDFIFFDKNGDKIIITTNDIRENMDSRHGSGQNIEIYSDTDAAFRFTKIIVTLIDKNKNIPEDRIGQVYKKEILGAINIFIDSYRQITHRDAIANVQDLTSLRNLSVYRENIETGQSRGLVTLSFGSGGLSPLRPLRTQEEHSKIQDILNFGGPKLEDLFIMEAQRQSVIGHSLEALINAVIALEISIRSGPSLKLNIFEKIIFFRKKLILQVKRRLESLNFEETDLVIGAIKDRHKIIHTGDRNIDSLLVEKYIKAIKDALDVLK